MLPALSLLEQIPQQILKISNRQGEFKRQVHYGLFLLCYGAGLRVSEALNFDLSTRTKKGLYRITKTKGQKERLVYIPKKVISELKKHNWKPNHTNRFNFYHFLRKIKRELNLPANIELSPHTLHRAFATYHAENGLPLPLLKKLLGHASIRTTALYWMNIYNEDDDNSDILTAKFWLKRPKPPQSESENPVNLNLEKLPELPIISKTLNLPYLTKIQQLENQLNQIQGEKDKEITELVCEKKTLQDELSDLSKQNTTLQHERSQIITEKQQVQQELTQAQGTIKQLAQELASERSQKIVTKNNLLTERQNNQSLREINANLTQKIQVSEQNYSNLQNAYQNAITAKQNAEKQLNQLINEVKNAAYLLSQWQKLNYYQQLEQQNKTEAKIIQVERPPPWK